MIKKIAAGLAAVAVTGASWAAMTPAAEAAPRPFEDTVHIRGNLDTGETGGYWARLGGDLRSRYDRGYERTVTITRDRLPNTWNVHLEDHGSFRTIPGKRSPQAGVPIQGEVRGTMEGTYDLKVTSTTPPSASGVNRSYDYRCNIGGSGNRAADCPGMPRTSTEWPKLYFPNATRIDGGAWRWTYTTDRNGPCGREQWVNSSSGNRGDITGRSCVRDVTPAAPRVRQPHCRTPYGRLSVPDIRGVDYSLRAFRTRPRDLEDGSTTPLRPGRYTVTASAERGYRIPGNVTSVWTIDIDRPRCHR